MSPHAVAVHARPGGVLLASADARGIRFLAAVAPGTPPAAAVRAVFGDDPPGIVVRVGATPGGDLPGAPRVLPVPVAVAVLAVGPEPPPGPVLVLDAGPDGTEATLVAPDRTVTPAAWPCAVPGARDPVPAAPGAAPPRVPAGPADAATVPGGPVEVVLAGERAADPAWVRAVAGSCGAPVRVAGPEAAGDPAEVAGAGPGTAAVLGAALLGAALLGADRPGTGAARTGEAAASAPSGVDGPDPMRLLFPALAVLGAVLVVAGLLVGTPGEPGTGVVVQYGFRAAVPAGWEHSGGDPARRRVLLTPAGRPDGADLVVVERSPLTYDAGREPGRAPAELAGLLGGRAEAATVAGRAVQRYVQRPGDGTLVDWHVLFDGGDQLVVGCRRPGAAGPAAACAEVVGSVRPVR
ncbi:type VII secretion-associated protein [Pseudonocardia sp. HH130630-07]|uniref:type VII secretion-associated protein n=1 Tax=Pseudonocardia sp. HH130630-07 TaxID=1690815 RepID=UPI000814F524|nr:type VII secretion-associated protein [Pseudonocardia sp. HH130630-07]ANY07441.1 hypothetical protein AFB00_15340 [Pseudonocardia sp. HH130630-07]